MKRLVALAIVAGCVLMAISTAMSTSGPDFPTFRHPSRGLIAPHTVYGTKAAAGDTTVIPAPAAGKRILVWGFKLVAEGTVNPYLKSGTTQMDSRWPLVANIGVFPAAKDPATAMTPYYAASPDQALVINADTTATVDYWFLYTEE
jgi:hypothetical protein